MELLMRAITTLLLLALSLGLSACSNPEAPAWLETYQETGELSGEAERGADASAPDEDAEADTSVEATDVEATDVEAPPLDTSADAGPECGEVEIPCNGVDDDCDPMTHDEACEQPGDVTQYATCVEGACTILSCAEGTQNQDQMAWVDGAEHCEVTCVEADVTCDGVDEDCDGLADSDALCPDQGPESISKCYASCMSEPCPPGSFDLDGDASNGCEYACTKSAEDDLSCDGVDDDCDGITDEDYASEPCDGDGDSCASGWTMCVSPDIVCLNDDGEEKACNGHDDDCDGVTDECAQPSDPASYATCVEGACSEESCAEGTQSQDAEGQNGCEVSCDASLSDDTCDGVDQDCDGETDEDVSPEPTSCGQGACANVGTRVCINGVLEDSCVALSPISELDATCDAVDDDCDGETDEEVPTLSCGKGICTQTDITGCIDGIPQACDPEAGKTFELCDDLDNDCDGQVDENFKAGGEVAAISMALDGSEPPWASSAAKANAPAGRSSAPRMASASSAAARAQRPTSSVTSSTMTVTARATKTSRSRAKAVTAMTPTAAPQASGHAQRPSTRSCASGTRPRTPSSSATSKTTTATARPMRATTSQTTSTIAGLVVTPARSRARAPGSRPGSVTQGSAQSLNARSGAGTSTAKAQTAASTAVTRRETRSVMTWIMTAMGPPTKALTFRAT